MMSSISIGASIDHSIVDGRKSYTFHLNCKNYHQIWSLLPLKGQPPRFTQLYIYDMQFESQNWLYVFRRFNGSTGVRLSTVEDLQHTLDECNPYIHVFRNPTNILHNGFICYMHIKILRSRLGG